MDSPLRIPEYSFANLHSSEPIAFLFECVLGRSCDAIENFAREILFETYARNSRLVSCDML